MTARPSFVGTLRRALWPLLVFEAAFELATLVALDPLLVLLLDRVVALGGDPFVGNTALVSFLLSPAGMLALPSAAIGVIFVGAVASGGASLILWRAQGPGPSRHLAVWRAVFARVPSLLALSAYAFAAALLLVVPVLAIAFAGRRWWLSGGDVYFYLTTRPPEFILVAALVAAVAAGALVAGLVLLLRTALAVPICLLRPVGVHQALRMAVRATHGRTRALLPRLLAAVLGTAALWAIFFAVLSALLDWLLARPMQQAALHGAGLGVAIAAALAFAALAAVSRGAVLLPLLRDKAAEEVLPRGAEPIPARARLARLRPLALLALCVAIPIAAAIKIATAGGAAPHPIAITAHRAGSARAPENTLAALDNAIAEGADVVEIDVQETADGKIVLLHDTDLRRVAGVARPIWQMRADELLRLDVGSWFAPHFRGERIPTLRAFAEAARGRVRLNVEVKNNGHGEDLAARTVAILREAGSADHAAISSLDIGLLREVRRIAPEIKLGLILATGIGNLHSVDVDFVALSRRLATRALIQQLTARGREVHVWTLDDDASIARAMLNGADNIITGDTLRAVRMRHWFDSLSEPERILLRVGYSFSSTWFRIVGRTGWSSSGINGPGADHSGPDDF